MRAACSPTAWNSIRPVAEQQRLCLPTETGANHPLPLALRKSKEDTHRWLFCMNLNQAWRARPFANTQFYL
jgi:hypothetical protein